jgi:hypothetical protein
MNFSAPNKLPFPPNEHSSAQTVPNPPSH